MRDPGSRESIVRSAARPALACALACVVVIGGACTRVAPPQSLAAQLRNVTTAIPDGALVVRLAFDASADLDLYVSDPLQETVYYANTPSRSGGALDRDRTCKDPAPRIETIVFERPPPGRYRIGVENAEPCGTTSSAPFSVRARHGDRDYERSGAVPPRRFDPIVLEFEIE